MTIKRYTGSGFEQAEYRGQMPVFRYGGSEWLDAYLDDGLVGYWPLESSNAEDYSGQGNDANLSGGVTTGAQGTVGDAYSFDGTDDLVEVPHDPVLNPEDGDWSVSVWVIIDSFTSSPAGIIEKRNTATGNDRMYGLFQNKEPNFIAGQVDDGSNAVFPLTNTFSSGVWQHIVLTWDASASTGTIYRNATQESQKTNSNIGTLSSTEPVDIGESLRQNEPIDGQIDEVRLYDRVLSSAEIEALYAQGRPV